MSSLVSFRYFIITKVSLLGHFSLHLSSTAAVYTSFQWPAESYGFLDGMALMFFPLHMSVKVNSKVCRAVAFQLMKRGSIPSIIILSILSSTSCAAPILDARTGLVTPSYILLMRGNRGHLLGSGFEPTSHVS